MALDIMDTNSGFWNTEAKEAKEAKEAMEAMAMAMDYLDFPLLQRCFSLLYQP